MGLKGGTPQDGHHLPRDGQPIGRSVCSFPRSTASRSTFTKRRDYPTFRAGMIRDRGQEQGPGL